MKLRKLVIASVMSMSAMGMANAAAIYDGNDILYSCEQGHLRCIHYLAGVQDAWNELDSKKYCLPEEVKLADLKDVYIKYAKQHPERLNFPASTVVVSALNQAFPCE
ncbi:MAG: Rap1a/Tai family immunity protein [Desulfobulbia bacterium]